MRRLLRCGCLVGLLLVTFAAAARGYRVDEIPNVQRADAGRFVSNPDGILSAEAVARLDRLCDSLRRAGTAETAVVAVREIDGDDLFEFAHALFTAWGVGRAERNDGLGILLVEGRREVRFVTGDGLEGVLPDAVCKRIQLNDMIPYFRRGDYGGGMVAGLEAVARRLSDADAAAEEAELVDAEELRLVLFWAVGAPLLFVLLLWLFTGRCPRCRRRKLQLERQEVVRRYPTYRVVEATYVCKACGKKVVRRRNEPLDGGSGTQSGLPRGGVWLGGSGGFGSGSMGGGFGGGHFGGGHFGGGGAGSRW